MANNGNNGHHQVFQPESVPHQAPPPPAMSLNVHLAPPPAAESAAASSGGHTPNTPEILNSIVNMQAAAGGPFAAGYASATAAAAAAVAFSGRESTAAEEHHAAAARSPTEAQLLHHHQRPPIEVASPSSMSSVASSSPVGSEDLTPSSSMGVQDYRRLFIKEGLKMKVQQKIGSKKEIPQVVVHPPSPMDQKPPFIPENPPPGEGTSTPMLPPEGMLKVKEELTEEDEHRRHRRRERNKVAATKCRNKKKARSANLMKESELLEAQNKTLKSEIGRLEGEKKRLMEMLSTHDPTCAKRFKEMTAVAATASGHNAHAPVTTEDHFRVPVAAAAAAAVAPSKRPPSPPSLDAVQNSYGGVEGGAAGFDYSAEDGGVKTEGAHAHAAAMMDVDRAAASFGVEQGCFLSTRNPNYSCGFPDPSSSATGHFLGKRSLSQTYLDLDSRCIAL